MKSSKRQAFNLRLAIAIPLCASLVVLVAAHMLHQRAKANWRECAACERTAESLAPYLDSVQAYEAVKARLRETEQLVNPPEPPMGVPPAGRAREIGEAIDGFQSVRDDFVWPSLKTGQAFAVLEAFASAKAWRIAKVSLKAMPDGENSSLRVTIESVVPEDSLE